MNANPLVEKMMSNLNSIAGGLQEVKSSIEKAGFKEALPGYQEMRETLYRSRILWNMGPVQADLDENWGKIEAAARDSLEILKPFCEVFEGIVDVATMQITMNDAKTEERSGTE